MWTGLPDLNALLLPVLTWATTAVATIAAIALRADAERHHPGLEHL